MTSILLERERADCAERALSIRLVTGQEAPIDLIERSAALESPGPCSRAHWWNSWWRHMRPRGSELFLLGVWHGQELVGLAPWYASRYLGYGRVVRFLGDGRACSDYATISTAPGYREDVWREVAHWIVAESGRSWDTFILSGVSAEDQEFQTLCQRIGETGIHVDTRAVANTWRIALPDTWEEYVALFSKQHRSRIRKTKREMFDSGKAVLRRVTNQAEFEQGFALERRLHQARRHSLGDAGCFADHGFEAFLREALEGFFQHGKLRLQWTEVDGAPVAFDSSCVEGDTVFVYQTAFDPAHADLSPGRLHLQGSIMQAIDEGYKYFDFMRGDESYKAHLRATPIPVMETRLISPRVLPSLRHRLWSVRKKLQERVAARRGRLQAPPKSGEGLVEQS